MIPQIGGVDADSYEVDAGLGNSVLLGLVRQDVQDDNASINLVTGSTNTKIMQQGQGVEIVSTDGSTFNFVYVSIKGTATNGDVVDINENDTAVILASQLRYDFPRPAKRAFFALSKPYTSNRYATIFAKGYE
jgi:hypothetical protein